MIYYKEPVYRPPAEANSLLIQVTEGCSFSCDFCAGNLGKKFLIRNTDDIKKDLINAKKLFGDYYRKMFLLDGNAFVIPADMLVEIADFSYELFPKLKRISAYAHAKDILAKSHQELQKISDSGVKMVYLGIETGDDDLLTQINKRVTSDEIAEAAHKLYKANISLSATIILGLAGNDKEKSKKHAQKTAQLINRLVPENNMAWYISALTLMIPPQTRIYNKYKTQEFVPLTHIEILEELRYFMLNLNDNLERCIFRSNHASNYLPLESNNLARNKDKLIEQINFALNNTDILRNESFRGL